MKAAVINNDVRFVCAVESVCVNQCVCECEAKPHRSLMFDSVLTLHLTADKRLPANSRITTAPLMS